MDGRMPQPGGYPHVHNVNDGADRSRSLSDGNNDLSFTLESMVDVLGDGRTRIIDSGAVTRFKSCDTEVPDEVETVEVGRCVLDDDCGSLHDVVTCEQRVGVPEAEMVRGVARRVDRKELIRAKRHRRTIDKRDIRKEIGTGPKTEYGNIKCQRQGICERRMIRVRVGDNYADRPPIPYSLYDRRRMGLDHRTRVQDQDIGSAG